MEFKELFQMQEKLDQFIEQNKQIDYDVFQEKGLALLVELAELANETRCFKFWSSKGPSEKKIILEEFVDSIHFLLSLGNKKGFSLDAWPEVHDERNLTELFLEVQKLILHFIENPTEETYVKVWEGYGTLAYNLHFTLDDIIQAYIEKNKKNYERQLTGY